VWPVIRRRLECRLVRRGGWRRDGARGSPGIVLSFSWGAREGCGPAARWHEPARAHGGRRRIMELEDVPLDRRLVSSRYPA
jgi:hypothetical protein